MTSSPPETTDPSVRRSSATVQSLSRPVYPSYHLDHTLPVPNKPRPTDLYRPLNILRSSPRPIVICLPPIQDEMTPESMKEPRPVRAMEEFIAVVFGNEVWMGLVDFKSDKPYEEEPEQGNEFVRDLKRSSVVIVPRTFRTPLPVPPPRIQSPLYEEGEYEIRVGFDMSGKAGRNVNYRATSPPGGSGLWAKKDSLREKERKEIGIERKESLVEKERRDKEKGGRKGTLKEIKKGLPPMAVVRGHKYPVQQPRSILKRTEASAFQQEQNPGVSTLYPDLTTGPADISFVKQVRPPLDRNQGRPSDTSPNKVISAEEFWNQNPQEQNICTQKQSQQQSPPISPDPPPVSPKLQPTVPPPMTESLSTSKLSPTSAPFVPSASRHGVPILSPCPRRATMLSAYTAEEILGRFTPDSAISKTLQPNHPASLPSEPEYSDDENDWSTTVSSPITFVSIQRFLPAHLSTLKISLRTEIYSPHPAGAPPSSPMQAYSRVILIDTLDCPVPYEEKLQWFVPPLRKREFDNRLYYPAMLALHTGSTTIEIEEGFSHLGNGKFWCGGFTAIFSSRRPVAGDVHMIKASLREECSWLDYIEGDISAIERWISLGEGKEGKVGKSGQWRDESGKAVKRELRPEMFI